MEKTFFFDATVTDGVADITYSAADLAAAKRAYLTDGVLTSSAFEVSYMGSSMISISGGAAVIYGYTYVNTTPTPYGVLSPDAAFDRIDLMVLRLDLERRLVVPTVIKGEPAMAPRAPECVQTEVVRDIPIAQIYVPYGNSDVGQENIIDARKFSKFAPDENAKRGIVEEYLSALDLFTEEETESLRQLMDKLTFEGDAGDVLCADGEFRTPENYVRVKLAEYNKAGSYTFSATAYPSEGNRYDVVITGGGGGGGCVKGDFCRGGGGGAGAYLSVQGLEITSSVIPVSVGAGGAGTDCHGEDGGESSFGNFYACGGKGGSGGVGDDAEINGGGGGENCMYRANSGGDGVIGLMNESLVSYGGGADGFFGSGGKSTAAGLNAPGVDAPTPGAGGSGGGCPLTAEGITGGRGGDGCVIVYGYRSGLFN